MRTQVRMAQEAVVLWVQDTTSLDFAAHPATTGLGPLENDACRGLLVHTTLAVSADGVPLGLLRQQVWVRSENERGKRHQRHETAFSAKESFKWVLGLATSDTATALRRVTVCDREAHIYDFLVEVEAHGADFVVRAAQGRSTTVEGVALFGAASELTLLAQQSLSLKRHPERAARTAVVEVRTGRLSLRQPQRSESEAQQLAVGIVEVSEPNPPEGEEAVHWVLLTSLPVETPADAEQVVRYYTYRWLIERLHYVLKSGCKLEASQLRTGERLERLLALYSLVAWRLLWLTYQARSTPDASCEVALQPHEWQALYAHHHRHASPSAKPPTLREATRWIAQLGGFLGRKGDGEPGVKVLWRGWMRLQDIVDTWRIFHPSPSRDVGNA